MDKKLKDFISNHHYQYNQLIKKQISCIGKKTFYNDIIGFGKTREYQQAVK